MVRLVIIWENGVRTPYYEHTRKLAMSLASDRRKITFSSPATWKCRDCRVIFTGYSPVKHPAGFMLCLDCVAEYPALDPLARAES